MEGMNTTGQTNPHGQQRRESDICEDTSAPPVTGKPLAVDTTKLTEQGDANNVAYSATNQKGRPATVLICGECNEDVTTDNSYRCTICKDVVFEEYLDSLNHYHHQDSLQTFVLIANGKPSKRNHCDGYGLYLLKVSKPFSTNAKNAKTTV